MKIASLAEFGSVRDIGEVNSSRGGEGEHGSRRRDDGFRGRARRPGERDDVLRVRVSSRDDARNKRVFNAVAVEKNVLYIMNAQVFEKGDDATAEEIAAVASVASALRRVMRAFDVGRESVAS